MEPFVALGETFTVISKRVGIYTVQDDAYGRKVILLVKIRLEMLFVFWDDYRATFL